MPKPQQVQARTPGMVLGSMFVWILVAGLVLAAVLVIHAVARMMVG